MHLKIFCSCDLIRRRICMTEIEFLETCRVHSWWQPSVLCCSMQHTEEVSMSTETTRITSVQETTTTVISGDNVENSTVTTTATESSQQVTSSGDAPSTGKLSGSCMPIVISVYLYIKEKTASETRQWLISKEYFSNVAWICM